MKRFLGIILLLCLIVPFYGAWQFYTLHIHHLQGTASKRIKESLDPHRFVLLKFSATDSKTKLEWEHSREFKFKGNMYDIVCQEQYADSIWYWCFFDKEQSDAEQLRHDVISRNIHLPSEQQKRDVCISHFFKNLFQHHSPDELQLLEIAMINSGHAYTSFIPSHSSIPPFPPPEA